MTDDDVTQAMTPEEAAPPIHPKMSEVLIKPDETRMITHTSRGAATKLGMDKLAESVLEGAINATKDIENIAARNRAFCAYILKRHQELAQKLRTADEV